MRNAGLKFICKFVHMRVEATDTPYTQACSPGEVLRVPIAHMEGNYFCDAQTLERLQRDERIVFRYCDSGGRATAEANPNGALDNIAGICNEGRNVLGLMPHPERASEKELGSEEGFRIFESLVGAMAGERV
jgi:phosphoribosylformylglycinamidine synthase